MNIDDKKEIFVEDEKCNLTESEEKVWKLCNRYIEREFGKLNMRFKEYENTLGIFKERLDKFGKITIEDLEKESRLKSIYKIIDDIYDMKSRYRLNELEQMGDEHKQEYLDYFDFVLKEIESLQPDIFEKFKDNYNENGKLNDMNLMEILLKAKKLRYYLGGEIDSRLFAIDKMRERIEKLEKSIKDFKSGV